MNFETLQYFSDTQKLAEAAFEQAKKSEDHFFRHETANAVMMARSIDPELDSEEEIKQVCDEVVKRLAPFLR
jgi:hypothetical protein